MKLLVFSDSHGDINTIKSVLQAHHATADTAIFAGDGASDFMAMAPLYPDIAFIAVRGNCDRMPVTPAGSDIPYESTLLVCGHKLFITHGHLHHVKLSTMPLIRAAESEAADIVIFGHTHIPCYKYIPDKTPPLYLFNPGSAASGSFGIIELRDNGVLMSHGNV